MAKTKKQVVTEFRTAEILRAAQRVFARRGFDSATIDDVAKAAGVAKGTVYLYYRSKRDLYCAALKQGIQELRDETGACMDAAGTAEGKILAFMRTRARHFDDHRDFFRLYAREFGKAGGRRTQLQKFLEDQYLEQAATIRSVFEQAMTDHTVREVRADVAAFAILDVTRGLTMQRVRGWSKTAIDDSVRSAFDIVWKGIVIR